MGAASSGPPRAARGLLTPRRLRTYPFVVLIGAVIGYGVFLATSDGLKTVRGGRIGGDFPAFWGAGKIVAEEKSAQLYLPEAQRVAQRGLLPSSDMWIHYAYPPYVALIYVPFSYLSFKSAYVLHTLLMGLAVFLALRLLRPHVPPSYFGPALAASLTFYPLYKAVVGGQNTALSLLCAAAAASFIADGRFVRAGLCLGLWCFKPQLALPAAFVIAVAYPRIIPGLAAGLVLLYCTGTLVGGWLWPQWWWQEGVVPFAAAGLEVDRGNGISVRELAAEFSFPAGWALSGLIFLVAVFLARRPYRQPLAVVALATATSILVSPHTLYYDAGLTVLGGLLAGSVGSPVLIVTGWLIGTAQPLRGFLLLPPGLLVVLLMLFVSYRQLTRLSPTPAVPTR
jgi:hypothetical protein